MLDINDGKIFLKNTEHVFYDEIFAYLIYERAYRQGWKIHVSCKMSNYINIFNIVFSYLIKNKISFKYIYNQRNIKKFLSGDAPYTQLGKIITIYTIDDDSCRNILSDLYILVKDFEGPYIISDRQYKDSILYFRYGIFENDGIDYLIDDSGEYFEDIREYYNVPDFKHDLFIDDNINVNVIGKEVIPHSIVHTSASGNVYSGLYGDRQIILKEAKKNVIGVNGTAIDDLLNEVFFLRSFGKLNKNKLQIIDSFFEFGNYYIVLNKIEGYTLDYHKATSVTFEDYITIFKGLFNLVLEFHNSGVILNDISLSNFMYSEGEVLFVDFGSSYLTIDDNYHDNMLGATTDFYDSRVKYLDGKASDFHKLGYLMMGYICSANLYLRIDPSGQLSLEKFEDYCKVEGLYDLYKCIEPLILQKDLNVQETFLENLFSAREGKQNILSYSLDDLKKLDMNQTNYFLKEFKDEIDETMLIFSELSEGLSMFEYRFELSKVVSWLKNVPDYSLSKGYIGFVLLCMSSDIPEDMLDIYIEEVDSRIVNEEFDNFSLEIGSLGIALYLLKRYMVTQKQSYLNQILNILDEIHSKSIVLDGRRYFVEDEFSTNISPYLSDGLSGFLFIVCQLYHSVKDENIRLKLKQDYLLEYLESISSICWTKFGGLWRGGLGVSMVQIDMAYILKDEFLMDIGLALLKRTIELGVVDSDVLIPVDFIRKSKDMSFMNGFLGNYIVVKYILKIMEGSDEVIFKEYFI